MTILTCKERDLQSPNSCLNLILKQLEEEEEVVASAGMSTSGFMRLLQKQSQRF